MSAEPRTRTEGAESGAKELQWSWITELYEMGIVIGGMWSLKSMKSSRFLFFV